MTETEHRGRRLLLLAGSGESRSLAEALSGQSDIGVVASLLAPMRTLGHLPVTTRIGPFGGDEAFARHLVGSGITAVLDATHPFTARIGARSALACACLGIPFARLRRPPWQQGVDGDWTEVAREGEVAALLSPGQRVFATTGRATLDELVQGSDARFYLRRVGDELPSAAPPNVTYVRGTGPFSVGEEVATFRRLEIDVLVAKNSGGIPSRTKLQAARVLGLPVILIARPDNGLPEGTPVLEDVPEAMAWIAAT